MSQSVRLKMYKYDPRFCACCEQEIYINFPWNLATEARERRLKNGKASRGVRQGRTKEAQREVRFDRRFSSRIVGLYQQACSRWKGSKKD